MRLRFFLAGVCVASAQAASVPNFAAANLVLGQPDFLSGNLTTPLTASSLNEPSAVVVHAASGKVFVADTGGNRVLRYANAKALQNGAAAELVFGQPDFTSEAAPLPPSATSLNSPTGLWVESSGRLWVADSDNHRVLLYTNAVNVAANQPAATLVFGQSGFLTADSPIPPTAASLRNPQGLCVDSAGRLWVVDQGNHRVLRFGTTSPNVPAADKPNGANADGVLGQAQFTTSTSGTGNTQFSDPVAATMDATGTLWVADRANNRVLGFPSAGTVSNGTNAARILGQSDFNGSVSAGTTSAKFNGPSGVFADSANQLWVLDQGNNRALRFADLKSIENGKPAISVVGQADFTSNLTGLNARRFDNPFLGLFVDAGGSLWVSSLNQHRILRFRSEDDTRPVVRIKGKKKRVATSPRFLLRGTASDDVGVTRVKVRVNTGPWKRAKGTTSWKRTLVLKSSRSVVRAVAFDASGRKSRPARIVILRE